MLNHPWLRTGMQSIPRRRNVTLRVGGLHKGSLRDSKRLSIYRVLGYFPGRDPDVDSLGFPFRVCKAIFLELRISDLASCMAVCKEWRSFIDTCDFWRSYLSHHHSNKVVEPEYSTALYWWKYNQSHASSSSLADCVDEPYVFRPFPDLWECGVVVPSGLSQYCGNIDEYHSLIKAMSALAILQKLSVEHGFQNMIHVCLFRWISSYWKPHAADVMNIFNAHIILTRDVERNQGEDEVLSRIVPPQGVDYQGQTRFIEIFSKCFQLGTKDWMVAFQCSKDVLKPAPGFIITLLSPGWAGGLLYAV